MGGDHQRDLQQLLDQAAPQVSVPGVTVDDVGGFNRPGHDDVAVEGIQKLRLSELCGGQGFCRANAGHCFAGTLFLLIAEA